jgi:hypothetical protein
LQATAEPQNRKPDRRRLAARFRNAAKLFLKNGGGPQSRSPSPVRRRYEQRLQGTQYFSAGYFSGPPKPFTGERAFWCLRSMQQAINRASVPGSKWCRSSPIGLPASSSTGSLVLFSFDFYRYNGPYIRRNGAPLPLP